MMKGAVSSILDAVGNTPMVKLNNIGGDVAADIYVKCEFLNPAGSMKDRNTLYMVAKAVERGDLKPGGTIIEATSGNTGAGLAMIAAVRGYKCIFVMPDKMSDEKVHSLRAFGARVVVCPTAVEPEDPRSYYSVSKRLSEETPNSFYVNQYENLDNPAGHYASTGPEIWAQTGGEVDVFVAGLGTGGTITGAGRYLKEHKPGVQLVGVDPVGSLYYDFVKSGRVTKPFTYKVEGIGEDFFPATIDLDILDEIVRVDDRECFLMTRDLVRLEGLYVGGSSGAAISGALKYARQTQKKENIVVLLPDGAAKYLSKIFNDDWMRENGFLETDAGLGVVGDLLGLKSREVIAANHTDVVRDVIARMKDAGISQMPVLKDGRLSGVVAEVDLLHALVSGEEAIDAPVGGLVQSDYATVSSGTKLELLQGLLGDARMAVVLEGDEMRGVVTRIDLIDFLARPHRPAALSELPPAPDGPDAGSDPDAT